MLLFILRSILYFSLRAFEASYLWFRNNNPFNTVTLIFEYFVQLFFLDMRVFLIWFWWILWWLVVCAVGCCIVLVFEVVLAENSKLITFDSITNYCRSLIPLILACQSCCHFFHKYLRQALKWRLIIFLWLIWYQSMQN